MIKPETEIKVTRGVAGFFVETSHSNYVALQDSKGWNLKSIELNKQEWLRYLQVGKRVTEVTTVGSFFGPDLVVIN